MSQPFTAFDHQMMARALQLAERLGAQARTLRSEGDVAAAFLDAARQLNRLIAA